MRWLWWPGVWTAALVLAAGGAVRADDVVRLREDGVRQVNKRNCEAAVTAWMEAARQGDEASIVLLCTSFNVAEKGCQMDRDENRKWCDAAAPYKQDPQVKDILHDLRGKTDRGEL